MCPHLALLLLPAFSLLVLGGCDAFTKRQTPAETLGHSLQEAGSTMIETLESPETQAQLAGFAHKIEQAGAHVVDEIVHESGGLLLGSSAENTADELDTQHDTGAVSAPAKVAAGKQTTPRAAVPGVPDEQQAGKAVVTADAHIGENSTESGAPVTVEDTDEKLRGAATAADEEGSPAERKAMLESKNSRVLSPDESVQPAKRSRRRGGILGKLREDGRQFMHSLGTAVHDSLESFSDLFEGDPETESDKSSGSAGRGQ